MKRTIFIIIAALLLAIHMPAMSQGLYTPEPAEETTTNTSTGIFQQDSPMLKNFDDFGGGGTPGQPGGTETPVRDALWVVVLLSGIYLIINKKYQVKEK